VICYANHARRNRTVRSGREAVLRLRYRIVIAEARDFLNPRNSPRYWNARTIAEFHRNHGKVGGPFEGAPLLLLHHIGARSGKSRINPVMYLRDGDRYIIFASKGGADSNPDYYYNIKAHPDIQIEVGDETIDVRAEEITGLERDRLFARQASLYPAFGEYQRGTKRTIPVVALIPKT